MEFINNIVKFVGIIFSWEKLNFKVRTQFHGNREIIGSGDVYLEDDNILLDYLERYFDTINLLKPCAMYIFLTYIHAYLYGGGGGGGRIVGFGIITFWITGVYVFGLMNLSRRQIFSKELSNLLTTSSDFRRQKCVTDSEFAILIQLKRLKYELVTC